MTQPKPDTNPNSSQDPTKVTLLQEPYLKSNENETSSIISLSDQMSTNKSSSLFFNCWILVTSLSVVVVSVALVLGALIYYFNRNNYFGSGSTCDDTQLQVLNVRYISIFIFIYVCI